MRLPGHEGETAALRHTEPEAVEAAAGLRLEDEAATAVPVLF